MHIDPLLALPNWATTYQVAVNGTHVAVLDVHPPNSHTDVHLMHGFTGSKEDFWDLAGLLGERGFRVVAHDHRGQNQSAHASKTTYALEVLAQDAIDIAMALGLRSPHLLGHSFGGLVARRAAIMQPALWSSLTLFCTGPGPVTPMMNNLKNTVSILTNRTMEQAWDYFLEHADEEVPIHADTDPSSMYARRWKHSDSQSVLAQANILMNAVDETVDLAQTHLPVHVVYGEYDDAWPLSEQDAMAHALAADITVIPDAGHCPNEEVPEVTAQVLSSWWSAQSTYEVTSGQRPG